MVVALSVVQEDNSNHNNNHNHWRNYWSLARSTWDQEEICCLRLLHLLHPQFRSNPLPAALASTIPPSSSPSACIVTAPATSKC